MKIIKKLFSLILRLSISVILLVLLFKFKNIDIKALFENIKNIDKSLLFLAGFIFSLNYLLCFLRWRMLLAATGINLPAIRLITSFCGGVFFNLFLPSTIGGDVARSIDLAAYTKRPSEVVATVFLDRLSGYIGLVILVLFSLFLGWGLIRDNTSVIISVVIITAILIGVLLFLFNNFLFSKVNRYLHSPDAGRIRQALKNLHRDIHHFRTHKRMIINNLLLSIAIQMTSPISAYMIALSLGLKIKIIYFFIFLPIIGAITLLPISIGGLGLRENLTVFFFVKVGVAENPALLISLLTFFFLLICGALGGLIYVLTVHTRRIQYSKTPPVNPANQ